jgi:ketosteroid isomerase-like protein
VRLDPELTASTSLRAVTVDEDRAELARLEESWMQAVADRDMDLLERLVAPHFRFMAIHLYPEPMTREQWLDAAREGYTIVSFAFESMEIDVEGDTGIIHSRYSQVASYQHVSLSNAFRLTDVWTRADGRWRVMARHSSILG